MMKAIKLFYSGIAIFILTFTIVFATGYEVSVNSPYLNVQAQPTCPDLNNPEFAGCGEGAIVNATNFGGSACTCPTVNQYANNLLVRLDGNGNKRGCMAGDRPSYVFHDEGKDSPRTDKEYVACCPQRYFAVEAKPFGRNWKIACCPMPSAIIDFNPAIGADIDEINDYLSATNSNKVTFEEDLRAEYWIEYTDNQGRNRQDPWDDTLIRNLRDQNRRFRVIRKEVESETSGTCSTGPQAGEILMKDTPQNNAAYQNINNCNIDPSCPTPTPRPTPSNVAPNCANDPCGCINNEDEKRECEACVGDGTQNRVWTGIGCVDTSRDGVVTRIFQIGIGVIGGLMIVRFIQAAFMMQTDNPEQIREAQEIVTSAIIALIVLVGAVVILRFLGINVLGILPFEFLQ